MHHRKRVRKRAHAHCVADALKRVEIEVGSDQRMYLLN
jgi:hypothetical protein